MCFRLVPEKRYKLASFHHGGLSNQCFFVCPLISDNHADNMEQPVHSIDLKLTETHHLERQNPGAFPKSICGIIKLHRVRSRVYSLVLKPQLPQNDPTSQTESGMMHLMFPICSSPFKSHNRGNACSKLGLHPLPKCNPSANPFLLAYNSSKMIFYTHFSWVRYQVLFDNLRLLKSFQSRYQPRSAGSTEKKSEHFVET